MSKVNLQTQRVTVPTVFVTKGRQRVKQHDNNIVYLKNGDEFELEFFNPTSNKVLAKINLNGKSLNSGIVLRPGERVFLERYLDEAKKFLFETYEVDSTDPNVKEAIKNNGEIDVEFFDEYRQPYIVEWPIVYHYHYDVWPWWHQPYTPTWTYYSSTGGNSIGGSNSITVPCSGQNTTYTCNTKQTMDSNSIVNAASVQSIETGRVEKGSYSDQHFTYDSTSFNYYCSWKYIWKILPESQKAFTKEDLKVFCPSCGARRKKASHKFCPNCGQKFN